MPIAFERDDDRRLIRLTVTEPYSFEDILGVIDRQMAEGTWGYAVLYDWRAVTRLPTDDEVQRSAERVQIVGGGQQRGPVGIIAIGAHAKILLGVGLRYGALTKEIAAVEVVFTPSQLEAWMARNTRQRPGS